MKRRFRTGVFAGCAAVMVCLVMLSVSSCHSNTSSQEEPEFTQQDTADIRNIAVVYMDLLKSGDYESAARMLLKEQEDSSLSVLTEDEIRSEVARSEMFPCLNYTIDTLMLNADGGSVVKCIVEFFEKDPDDPRPNTIGFTLCPVKDENGEWKLVKADKI
ncbi:MAG: hypothetical protein LUD00_00025 [Prevotellaceae bacterium]|nr:hypothetical protein [Prevotellaceae bacterium]